MPRDLASEVTRLLAAGSETRAQAAEPLQALLADPEDGGSRLWQEMQNQRLSALVGSRAIELSADSLPSGFSAAVAIAAETNRNRALGIETLGQQVTNVLSDQDIESLPLKGPFFARRAYGDPGMRTVSDLDVLVAPDHLDQSVNRIRELGYVSDDPAWTRERPDLHYVLRSPSAQLPRIEVHWRVHWYEDAFSRDMLARSAPDRNGTRVAQIDDELAALLLYYARDGFYGLRLAADIAAWLDSHQGELEKPALARHWIEYPALRRAFQGASRALAGVVGTRAGDLIPNSRPGGARVRAAARLQNWRQRGELDQQVANVALVDGLLAPRHDLRSFFRRYVFLSRLEIADIYGLDPDRRLKIALWRAAHPPKVLARYTLGLLRAVGRPAG